MPMQITTNIEQTDQSIPKNQYEITESKHEHTTNNNNNQETLLLFFSWISRLFVVKIDSQATTTTIHEQKKILHLIQSTNVMETAHVESQLKTKKNLFVFSCRRCVYRSARLCHSKQPIAKHKTNAPIYAQHTQSDTHTHAHTDLNRNQRRELYNESERLKRCAQSKKTTTNN